MISTNRDSAYDIMPWQHHGNDSHLERQNELSYRHLPLKMAAIAMVKVNNALPLFFQIRSTPVSTLVTATPVIRNPASNLVSTPVSKPVI